MNSSTFWATRCVGKPSRTCRLLQSDPREHPRHLKGRPNELDSEVSIDSSKVEGVLARELLEDGPCIQDCRGQAYGRRSSTRASPLEGEGSQSNFHCAIESLHKSGWPPRPRHSRDPPFGQVPRYLEGRRQVLLILHTTLESASSGYLSKRGTSD